jgi:lipoprotein-anchoring transpeptidase ErfK/SrfK
MADRVRVQKQVSRPLTVESVSPSPGSTNVSYNSPIIIKFSEPLNPNAEMPQLNPPLNGFWQYLNPQTLEFVPTNTPVPGFTETLQISNISSISGSALKTFNSSFTYAAGSITRLNQLLAMLNYLPVSFTPSVALSAIDFATTAPGTFQWKYPQIANVLQPLWQPDAYGIITKGAVMQFEDNNGLSVDGVAGPKVWQSLLSDVEAGKSDPNSYDNVVVSKNLPESLTVYQNGNPVYNTPVNTGIAAAPTADGTFTVYARYLTTTMSGRNPDGSYYSDPGIPWVSYFNGGDALHGFIRASYGFPQSLGCVEMPPDNAKIVYPLTPLGTLVTVTG